MLGPACGAVLSRDGKYPKIPGGHPRSPDCSNRSQRRSTGADRALDEFFLPRCRFVSVGYAFPRWLDVRLGCAFLPPRFPCWDTQAQNLNCVSHQISVKSGSKARRNRGWHPGFARRILPTSCKKASPVTGVRGQTAWQTRRRSRRSLTVAAPGGVLVTLPPWAK